jgi:hypothetical protein
MRPVQMGLPTCVKKLLEPLPINNQSTPPTASKLIQTKPSLTALTVCFTSSFSNQEKIGMLNGDNASKCHFSPAAVVNCQISEWSTLLLG